MNILFCCKHNLLMLSGELSNYITYSYTYSGNMMYHNIINTILSCTYLYDVLNMFLDSYR